MDLHLATYPSDWLKDIFRHLDFANQCRLRRVCGKWRSLLLSRSVIRNVVFDTPDTWHYVSIRRRDGIDDSSRGIGRREALRKLASRIHNFYIIAKSTGANWSGHEFLLTLFLQSLAFLGKLQGGRRFILVNMTHLNCFRYEHSAGSHPFRSVHLHKCGLMVTVFRHIQTDAGHSQLTSRCWPWGKCEGKPAFPPLFIASDSLTISTGAYSSCVEGVRLYFSSLRQLILANIPVLTAAEMEQLSDRLATCNQLIVREAARLILRDFPPDYEVPAEQPLDQTDYSRFSPILTFLLFHWDGVLP